MKRLILSYLVLLAPLAGLISFGYSDDSALRGEGRFGGASYGIYEGRDFGQFSSNEVTSQQDEVFWAGYEATATEEWRRWYGAKETGEDRAVGVVVDASGNTYVTGTSKGNGTLTDIVTVKYSPQGKVLWSKRFNGAANGTDEALGIALDAKRNVYVTGTSYGGEESGLDFITLKYNTNGKLLWEKRYNAPEDCDDNAATMAVDAAGNAYVTGRSWGGYAILKYDPSGKLLWEQRCQDYLTAIAVDAAGNVYIAGGSSWGGAGSDYATLKYDKSGRLLWEKRYNGTGNSQDIGRAIVVDTGGNVYVTGTSVGNGSNADYATLKYDASGNLLWEKRYNGPKNGDDLPAAIAVDAARNVYVTGTTGLSDYATLKYDASGNLLWEKRYSGPGNYSDEPTALAVDTAGNVCVTGASLGVGSEMDYATLKYDPSGNLLWEKRYSGPGNYSDRPTAMVMDAAGNVYVTGGSSGMGSGMDYATLKYDPSGNLLWEKRYNGPGNYSDRPTAMAVDAAGNVYVTGESAGSNFNQCDYSTLKYDASGKLLWAKRYNGPGNNVDGARAIAVDADGNVYVTGRSVGDYLYQHDYATLKYDTDGTLLWKKRYNGQANRHDEARAMAVDPAGNVYVTGNSAGEGNGRDDYVTLKYDAGGRLVWAKRYNGLGDYDDRPTAMAVDSKGNVYVTGYSDSSYDFATLKYNSSGKLLWAKQYNGPGNGIDHPTAVAVDKTGKVYVTGYSLGVGSNLDYATLKYDASGNLLWEKRYNGPGKGDDHPTAIALDAAGNVYVTGDAYKDVYGSCYATLKYDPNGNLLWEKRYEGPVCFGDYATAIALDAAGNVYVTGTSNGASSDYATLKYDTNGNLLWEKRTNGVGNSRETSPFLALDNSGNIYVTGSSDLGYLTVKFAQ